MRYIDGHGERHSIYILLHLYFIPRRTLRVHDMSLLEKLCFRDAGREGRRERKQGVPCSLRAICHTVLQGVHFCLMLLILMHAIQSDHREGLKRLHR